ncbi:Thioredoxin family protein [Hirschfeldia incana]|nr:Thioredoxin family protein [Hirschfeldia incana]KAJ0235140.1 Thioredoxin family protein [Hirschfeldia incana]KAJ0235142.1 Thioredoxin family protein [Hirschfeldia incana]
MAGMMLANSLLLPPQPSILLPVSSSSRTRSSRSSIRRALVMVKASSSSEPPDSVSVFTAPPGFKPPEPKRFAVKPGKLLDVLGAAIGVLLRFGTGVFVSGYSASFVSKDVIPADQYALRIGGITVKETSKLGPRPQKPIEIYEFEGCPFCRKVREMVTVLDLDILYYPCPRGSPNFRPMVNQMGGKQQFPYMVDPNTGVSMYESDGIIKYLSEKYGDGTVPLSLSLGPLTAIAAALATIGRLGKGNLYTPAKLPPKPLVFWAYEGSPFCKLVREVLVELELPHIQRSCARGSPKRQELLMKAGHFQVPYLEDPNTGVNMFESAEIIEYLKQTYAA